MSEKLLPIVPGCKALVYNCPVTESNGMIVTIIRFLGKVPGWTYASRWETDRLSKGTNGDIKNHFDESWLLRIDGGSFEHEKDEQLEKVK